MPARARPAAVALIALLAVSLGAWHCPPLFDLSAYRVVTLEPGPDLETRARTAFLTAKPGTIIELPEGRFPFRSGLVLTASHVVVRGKGPHRTILDFTGQQSGAQAILVRGDHFVAQDFAILNPVGDGIKTEFVDGATFQRVRVEWTGGPSRDNGDYGLYPAQSRNVLVTGCVVKGARDAGIYVGQSENIVVRWNFVEHNVLGIEIENSIDADVYGNFATGNTAGIVIFDLPNLPVTGNRARVFDNYLWSNNTVNFAAGGILRSVPGGSGILVIGAKNVEIFRNTILDHDTANLAIASFLIAQEPITDPNYDPYVEGIHVHGNWLAGGGEAPQNQLGLLLSVFFERIPDIVIGGYVDHDKIPGGFDPDIFPATLQVRDDLKICIHDNGEAEFASLNGLRHPMPQFDIAPHLCAHPPLAQVVLAEPPPVPEVEEPYSPEEIALLCGAGGSEVNWNAFVVDCPKLSDYRLFQGPDPRVDPAPEGFAYDLTTPLFSDYAQKDRFIFLPPGGQALYSETEPFDMPVGTIIAKTFSFRDESVDPPGEELVETRLLIHRVEGWVGLPFIWAEDLSEAWLSIAGGVREITVTDTLGMVRVADYEIPSVADCGSCHFGAAGDVPIGTAARLLNRDFDYPDGTENQLARMARLGLLAGAPHPALAPRLPFFDDPSDGTLEERAKAYLESNCAHCHNPQGRAGFTGLHLQHDAPVDTSYGICKRPVAAGSGSLGLTFDIVPGEPDESILVARMASVEPSIKMPELSKSLVHTEGVALVAEWIASLEGSCEP
jgi:parallel beta-helix repeat protein